MFRGQDKDTICALSTPPGRGGISVIRVSGRDSLANCQKIAPFLKNPESHRVYFGQIPEVDEVLITYFAEGRSYTGERTLEISCHGSPSIVSSILDLLTENGCRMAEKGEFTYRSFMNGNLDLVQAEGVLAMIESQSRRAAEMANRQLTGELSRKFQSIEEDLLWILANMEAGIDFSHEDIDPYEPEELKGRLGQTIERVGELIRSFKAGRVLADGYHVALIGRPNVGKSSLMNCFLQEDRAIVTDTAGTTRDLIHAQKMINGVSLRLTDTAGLRKTEDQVEKRGIEKTNEMISQADLLFYLIDLSASIGAEDLEGLKKLEPQRVVLIGNKKDLSTFSSDQTACEFLRDQGVQLDQLAGFFEVSALNGEGMDEVESFLNQKVGDGLVDESDVVMSSRQNEKLLTIEESLKQTMALLVKNESPEFVAFELQNAILSVHQLLGKDFDDQVMDRVFQEFCIGK